MTGAPELPPSLTLAHHLALDAGDLQLHAALDLLLMRAAFDHPTYRKTAMALLAQDTRIETQHSASDWAYHIAECAGKMGVDARFMAAVVIARLTGIPEILHKLLDIELKAAFANEDTGQDVDLDRLRQLHATMIAAMLRPLLKTAMGPPQMQRRLETEAARVRETLQNWTGTHLVPAGMSTPAAATRQDTGMSILLVLSWLPADPEKGAHLKQVMSYCHGLMMACHAIGRAPARIRLLLTYDDTTLWLGQNFQSYSLSAAAVVEEAVRGALGPDLAEGFSIDHVHPRHHSGTADWLRAVLASAEEFSPDVVIRWYGFYATNAVAPALHARWPVVGIQFNANNAVDPHADILLKQGTLTPNLTATDPRWRSHRIPLEVLSRRLEMTRDEAGLPADVFTLVSTLSGGRLEKAVSALPKPHLTTLLALFDTHPNLIWIWVGVHDQAALEALDPRLEALIAAGRIRCLEYSPDLRALYRHCDLYVHLPRMVGGGMGVAMAVAEDVAVLCHAGSDPCNFLPDNTVPDDWDAFHSQLTLLIDTVEARRDVAKTQARWLEERHSLLGVGREVLGFIQEARNAWLDRDRQNGDQG